MKKILVIDDDPDILEAVQLVLLSEDYSCETLSSGTKIYQKISDYNPDLIIIDVLLSGMDGRTICKALKQDALTKHIPIIMMSAHPHAKDTVKTHGADSFIPKPFSIIDLLETVKALLN